MSESGLMGDGGSEPFLKRTYRDSFRSSDLSFFHVAVEQTDLFIGIGNHDVNSSKEADSVLDAGNTAASNDARLDDRMNGRPDGRMNGRMNAHLDGRMNAHLDGRPDGRPDTQMNAQILREAEETARNAVLVCRSQLETQIRTLPVFLTSLIPIRMPAPSPPLIAEMVRAAGLADVGPMAAVAGAVAENVGRILAQRFSEVLVENGGDIWMTGTRERTAGLFCGNSPLNGKLGLRLPAGGFPIGLCTSSGTIGHSLSFGRADAATVKAKNAALADAVATGFGNRLKTAEDIPAALEWASSIPGVLGLLAVVGDRMGAWGDMELTAL